MLASLNLLEKFITLPKKMDANYDVAQITTLLTRQGFEVDSVQQRGEGFAGVVVGKIKYIEPHEGASKLQVCKVDVGEGNLRQIVCGAPNARLDLFVAVALPGTKLPGNIEIKPAQVRGVESLGMLCSRAELALPVNKETDGDGIWEISLDTQGGKSSTDLAQKIGLPIFEVLELKDILLEISVTPNRPDMLFHEGIARELCVGFAHAGIPFERKNPSFCKYETKYSVEKIEQDIHSQGELILGQQTFSVQNELNISTFFLALDKVTVGPSPAWLRNTLESLGQNSVNNVVDAANYILLAYGQPSHAFDFDSLAPVSDKEKKLVLRKAHAKEAFLGLDGKERELQETDAVVADGREIQALLGVLGGEKSKVCGHTQRIVVEFANPDPVTVRRTARRIGRHTDASFLFEKGIDISARCRAASEFCFLLVCLLQKQPEYLGACFSKNGQGVKQVVTQMSLSPILFRASDFKNVLGVEIISFEKQLSLLESLSFGVQRKSADLAEVSIPTWRAHDVVGAADLVEECIRVVGIDAVPAIPLVCAATVQKDDTHFDALEKLCKKSSALGYSEVMSLHFMRRDDWKQLGLFSEDSLGLPIELCNPIIGDEPLMHTTLIPDLLRKVASNLNYGVQKGQIFHACRTFQNRDKDGKIVFGTNDLPINIDLQEYHFSLGYNYSQEKNQGGRPVETPRLAGVVFGPQAEKSWQTAAALSWTLHDIIAHVMELCCTLGVPVCLATLLDHEEVVAQTHSSCPTKGLTYPHPMAPALHPGKRVGFYCEAEPGALSPIGWAGEFHPRALRAFEVDAPCFGFEINAAVLMECAQKLQTSLAKKTILHKFALVTRDFAFVLDEQTIASDLVNVVSEAVNSVLTEGGVPAELSAVNIFDIYRGKGVAENKKSVAFQIKIRPTEKTLTEKDITLVTTAVMQAVEQKLSGELRAG